MVEGDYRRASVTLRFFDEVNSTSKSNESIVWRKKKEIVRFALTRNPL